MPGEIVPLPTLWHVLKAAQFQRFREHIDQQLIRTFAISADLLPPPSNLPSPKAVLIDPRRPRKLTPEEADQLWRETLAVAGKSV